MEIKKDEFFLFSINCTCNLDAEEIVIRNSGVLQINFLSTEFKDSPTASVTKKIQ